jgi:hypothetical protein
LEPEQDGGTGQHRDNPGNAALVHAERLSLARHLGVIGAAQVLPRVGDGGHSCVFFRPFECRFILPVDCLGVSSLLRILWSGGNVGPLPVLCISRAGEARCHDRPSDQHSQICYDSHLVLAFGLGVIGAAHVLPRVGGAGLNRGLIGPLKRRFILFVDRDIVLSALVFIDLEGVVFILLGINRAGEAARQHRAED